MPTQLPLVVPASLMALHAEGRLLAHMIPGMPGDAKDAWSWDLTLFASPSGYEVCSLSLLHPRRRIYSTRYGIFAAVPEEEVLVLGANDLGANEAKRTLRGQGLSDAEMQAALRESVGRTHGEEMYYTYESYFQGKDKHTKRSPNNEVLVNLKGRHVVGLCINRGLVLTSRIRQKKEKELAQAAVEVKKILAVIKKLLGKDVPVALYDNDTNSLEGFDLEGGLKLAATKR